jgi:hypothetical protein
MNQITNEEVVNLLGLPPEFAPMANIIMVPSDNSGLVVRSTYKRTTAGGNLVDTLIERTFAAKTIQEKTSHALLNFMADKINQEMFVQVGPGEFADPGKNDETGFFYPTRIKIEGNMLKMGDDGVFMNIESQARQGAIGDTNGKFDGERIKYEDGWDSFEHHKTILHEIVTKTRKRGTGPLYGTSQEWNIITTTKRFFEKTTIVLTKDDIESVGWTDAMLATMEYRKWLLVNANPEAVLTSVACEILQVDGEENAYFPQVWINGQDDNGFNFRDLMTPWGYKACDFNIKITGWGDLTVEDLFNIDADGRTTLREDAPIFATSENPTMLGVGGKFCEVRFANENPPIIRVVEGDAYRATKEADGSLTIQFKAGDERKKLGMHIAWLPDTGKSDYYHVWLDLKTGEHSPNMWRV